MLVRPPRDSASTAASTAMIASSPKIAVGQRCRNQTGPRINWMFSTEKARTKMAALTSDAPDRIGELDRIAALDFLRAHLTIPQSLGAEDRFIADTELSVATLDEIDRELRLSAHSSLTVFVPGQSNPATFQDWGLAAEFRDWKKRGHDVCLAFFPDFIKDLSAAERLGLRDFALLHNVTLITAEAPKFTDGACALAMVETGVDRRVLWASRGLEARVPGPNWGRPVIHPVTGRTSIAVPVTPIDLDRLLPPPGAQVIRITSELDCDLATFGSRASKAIVDLIKNCGGWPRSAVARAIYRDPYVTSPLTARLLVMVSHIFSASGSTNATLIVETRSPRDQQSLGWQIRHDWGAAPICKKETIGLLGRHRGIVIDLRNTDVPHGRTLDLFFADGSASTVVLDQGLSLGSAPACHGALRLLGQRGGSGETIV